MKILKFEAKYCGSCKVLSTIISKLEPKIEIEKIDIEEDEFKVEAFGVVSLPTMIKVDDKNKEITRLIGIPPKEKLIEFLEIKE
jgi:thioredoxin-like negative regulator of GroEL